MMSSKLTVAIPLVFLTSLISPLFSHALNLAHLEGSDRREHASPNGLIEACIIPQRLGFADYKKSDSEKEQELCSYNFYGNVGICPKYNSTNPAILVLRPNNEYNKEQIDRSSCEVKKMNVKTDAKFKQSLTCSYTPSILAYYHVARAIGDVTRVPPSVIRTMDIVEHRKQTEKAVRHLQSSTDFIKQTWEQFLKYHRSPRSYPQVFDGTQSQVYGALSDNIRGEEQYVEISGGGDYETRYERMLSRKPFLNVTSSQSVSQLAGGSDFQSVAPLVQQMKDISDMVLLDTLLNQQDRVGNIHYKFYWHYPEGNKVKDAKSDTKIKNGKLVIPEQESQEMSAKGAVLVKEMFLRDNDCGVIKTNMMRQHNALARIRHMSYKTYKYFMKLSDEVKNKTTYNFFKRELLFSDRDWQTFNENISYAKTILLQKCQTGELKFDLDIDDYLKSESKTPNCLPQ